MGREPPLTETAAPAADTPGTPGTATDQTAPVNATTRMTMATPNRITGSYTNLTSLTSSARVFRSAPLHCTRIGLW